MTGRRAQLRHGAALRFPDERVVHTPAGFRPRYHLEGRRPGPLDGGLAESPGDITTFTLKRSLTGDGEANPKLGRSLAAGYRCPRAL